MRKLLALFFSAGVAAVISASPASADPPPGADMENLLSMEACYPPGQSKFDFTLWYNSGQNGSYRNIGYSVYDFNSLRPGDGSVKALKFCVLGASNPWPGSGQNVKNNAASGENRHYKYWARVHFYSGYKGPQDVMAPYQHIDQFRNVYNENASFQWTTS